MSKHHIKPFAPGFQTEKEWNVYADQTDALRVKSGEKPFLNSGNKTYEEIIDAKGNLHVVPKTPRVDKEVVDGKVAAIHREADRTAEDKSTAAEDRWFGFGKVAVGAEPLRLIEETGEYVKLLPPAVSSVVHVEFVQNQPQPEQAAAQEQSIAS
jgi:hypothetical protein